MTTSPQTLDLHFVLSVVHAQLSQSVFMSNRNRLFLSFILIEII